MTYYKMDLSKSTHCFFGYNHVSEEKKLCKQSRQQNKRVEAYHKSNREWLKKMQKSLDLQKY